MFKYRLAMFGMYMFAAVVIVGVVAMAVIDIQAKLAIINGC